MKKTFLAVAILSSGLASGLAHSQESVDADEAVDAVDAGEAVSADPAAEEIVTSEINASLRLGLGLTTEPDAELTFNDYSSRIGWTGTADAGDGLKALARVEFGYDQDEGVSTTRFAYLGVEGDFGTVTGGKQYTAFYDAVTSAVDIAYWGSCYFEISCSRQSSVLKFVGNDSGSVQFLASTTLIEGDPGNDFIDGIDLAAVTQSGDMTIGAGVTIDFDDTIVVVDDFGDAFEVEDDGGFAAGLSLTMPMDEATVSGTLQFASDDYLGGEDDGFLVTGTYAKDQFYGIVTVTDADVSPFLVTLGYQQPVIEDKAFAYFELGLIDDDLPGSDVDFQARAVMVYNLDI